MAGNKEVEENEGTEGFKLQIAKGVRDFPPEEKIIREKVINTLKQVFESYGYNPFETPAIERLDVLRSKFSAGEESDVYKEIFSFQDQGKRKLGLRFELTLGLCRFIGMNPNTKLPFKRYEIGRVYRDGPIKLGRYREFWQCDVDIVGCKSVLADAEVLSIVRDVFERLGFEIEIEINNRKLLNGMLEECGVEKSLRTSAMITIDKLKKVGIAEVDRELLEKGIGEKSIKKMHSILEIRGSNEDMLEELEKTISNSEGKEGLAEIREMLGYLKEMGASAIFRPTLARGLGYYTGPIYEVFLKDSEITSSVVGGGRYDEYIGNFLGGKKQIPATGLSFGLEPITDAMKRKEAKSRKSVSQVFIIPIGDTLHEAIKAASEFRGQGIRTELDLMGKGLSKNLNYANFMGIPFAAFIGEREMKEKKITLRNLDTGKEEMLGVRDAAQKIKG